MYLPRALISTLYLHLKNTRHTLSPPVLLLVALEPDALCACRILTHLLKRDYIPHKIQPIAGYGDLEQVGNEHVKPMMESQGGSGGVVVCLGVGGLVDLASLMGLEDDEDSAAGFGGLEIWVIDARRPWNLGNVFGVPYEIDENGEPSRRHAGVDAGRIERGYKPGKGGVIVFDDGDIDEELVEERKSYMALLDMPRIEDGEDEFGLSESESENEDEDDELDRPESHPGKKRKSWGDREEHDEFSDDEDGPPRQRRRSNSSSPILDSPTRRPNQRGLLSSTSRDTAESRSVSPTPGQPPKPESARKLRRRFLKLRRQHESVLRSYYSLGTSYSEPISSMMYSLASELGREDNDILWLTIIGTTSMELYGRSSQGVGVISQKSSDGYSSKSSGWLGARGSQLRQLLREEVRRLNPPELSESSSSLNRGNGMENSGIIPTTARSPTDNSIRLSPEPKFLLIRHWSLYDSMLHSPYLAARLHIWSEGGRKRLMKLLAKMGVSIVQSKQSYTHMDMELKRGLREKLLKYAKVYGLDELVPAAGTESGAGSKEGWGFVRSWGWRATLSSHDVSVVIGAILEIGLKPQLTIENGGWSRSTKEVKEPTDADGTLESREWVTRFYHAYDALEKIEDLKAALPIAQHLHRAILRTGTSLIEKRSIKHLRAYRLCVVKDGPDFALFTHPAALTKLALWVGEAIMEQDLEKKGKLSHGGRGTPLVVASLHEARGVYVVVGTGGGGNRYDDGEDAKAKARDERAKGKEEKKKAKEEKRRLKAAAKRKRRQTSEDDDGQDDEDTETESDGSGSESEEEEEDERSFIHPKGYGRNRFGNAFQEVVEETNARVKIDSFEHCVVEVRKEDLPNFLEGLSEKAVVG